MEVCVSVNVESQFSSGGGLEPGFFEFGWYCMIDVRVVRYCVCVYFLKDR